MGDKSLRLSILGNNLDAKAKIDEIDVKADDLSHKHPELSIGIGIAAASEKLAILRAELQKTRKEAEKSDSITLKGLGAGAFDFASGGLSGGWQDMNLFQKAIAGVGVATGIAEPAVAGLTVIVGALSAGVVSAGMGLGIFGLTAKAVWTEYATNISGAAKAQESIADGATGSKLAADNKALAASFKGLHGNVLSMVMGAANAETSWHNFTMSASQGVAGVLAPALQLVPLALQAVQPFLAPTEKALTGIVTSVGKGMGSAGFKSFMSAFSASSGKNLTNIAGAIGHIVVGIGGVLKAFLPMSTGMTGGLDNITKKFEKWGTTLSGHSGFKDLITEATQEGPKLVSAFKNIGGAVKNLLGDMAGMTTMSNSTLLWDMLNPLTGILKLLSSNPKLVDLALWGYAAYSSLNKVVNLKNSVTGLWTELGKMSGPLTKMGSSLKILKTTTNEAGEAQVAFNMELLASPITWIVVGLVLIVAGIYELSKHSEAFRAFWKAAWKDIKGAAADAFDWVKHNWPLILAILLGPIAVAALEIYKHWDDIAKGAEMVWHAISSFFSRLPGLLLGYVKDFGHLLMSAGSALISGLIQGIDHEAGALWSKATGIGHKLSGVFKSALSIFSPSKVFADHGKNIVLGLVQGIDGSAHLAETSVANLAQKAINASQGHFPGNSASSGAGAGVLQLEWTGSDQDIITLLKKWVRVRGGDPAVFGR